MNRRWKNALTVFLVTLMLVLVTGTAMAYKKNHKTNRENIQYTCQWGGFEAVAVGTVCIGNFSMHQ